MRVRIRKMWISKSWIQVRCHPVPWKLYSPDEASCTHLNHSNYYILIHCDLDVVTCRLHRSGL